MINHPQILKNILPDSYSFEKYREYLLCDRCQIMGYSLKCHIHRSL